MEINKFLLRHQFSQVKFQDEVIHKSANENSYTFMELPACHFIQDATVTCSGQLAENIFHPNLSSKVFCYLSGPCVSSGACGSYTRVQS